MYLAAAVAKAMACQGAAETTFILTRKKMKKQLRAAETVFIITLLITFLVCPGRYAAEETLPTPEETIAKNIEAIGGIKALKKIKNKKIVTISKFVQMNMDIKSTSYWERPNNFYNVLDTGVREGSNGKMAWDVNSSGTHLFEGGVLSHILRMGLFDGADGPDARYKSMKTEGIEQINGKACYKVLKTPKKGPRRTVYYDKKSFMIVKTTTDRKGNNKYSRYIEEYQKINNILFPYKIVTFSNGQKGGEMTYDKIELNIEIPKGIFDIPEEIKTIMNKN